MDTIIDTNILWRDRKLVDKNFEILFDYLTKTDSKLILPSIVIQELEGLYTRKLVELTAESKKALENLEYILVSEQRIELPNFDISEESSKYIQFLTNKLGISDSQIAHFKNEYLPELVSRAIGRKKPFDKKGQQFRDVLLWLTLLDYAETTKDKTVAFISENTRDFSSQDNNLLDEDLHLEASSRGISILYYKSLTDFSKDHATQISSITMDWIQENIDLQIIEHQFIEKLDSYIKQNDLSTIFEFEDDEVPTGYATHSGYINVAPLTFFLYEKRDGSILMNIDFEIEVEYELEIEHDLRYQSPTRHYLWRIDKNTGQEIWGDYFASDGDSTVYLYRYLYPNFLAKFVISIKNGTLCDYNLENWFKV